MGYLDAMNDYESDYHGSTDMVVYLILLFSYMWITEKILTFVSKFSSKTLFLWAVVSLSISIVIFSYSIESFGAFVVAGIAGYANFSWGKFILKNN